MQAPGGGAWWLCSERPVRRALQRTLSRLQTINGQIEQIADAASYMALTAVPGMANGAEWSRDATIGRVVVDPAPGSLLPAAPVRERGAAPACPKQLPAWSRHADAFAATPSRARAGLGARAGRRHAGPCRQDRTPAGQPTADRRRGRVSAVQCHRQEGPAGRLRRRYRQCLVQIDQRLVRADQAALGPDGSPIWSPASTTSW